MHNIGPFLNELLADYHQTQFLSSDPLEFVHHYKDPFDQEAVALLCAVLAYGNVVQIRKSIQDALGRIQKLANRPSLFVSQLNQDRFLRKANSTFESFVHRFNSGYDLIILYRLLAKSWETHGSLGSHFLQYLSPQDQNIGIALNHLFLDWEKWINPKTSSSFSYFLTAPKNGSCCKRWCMFLRWMGRKDIIDVGLWMKNSPLCSTFPTSRHLRSNQLVMPLDTHISRISQYLGLTQRKSMNWKAALEVTENLKKVDPEDPTRYDFALSRLGILDICQRSYRKEICIKCQLLPACQFAKKSSSMRSPSMRYSA